MVGLGATAAATLIGYTQARSFVRSRLRYVDQAHTPGAAVIAGVGACVIAAPVVAILPLVGAGTAILFGVAVGAGVAAGSKQVRQLRGIDPL